MPDFTAQQLHDLMQPLWERESELRPTELTYDADRVVVDDDGCAHDAMLLWEIDGTPVLLDTAAQLCESQMGRTLIEWGVCPTECRGISKDLGGSCFSVSGYVHGKKMEFYATTRVAALASACAAVLDAKAEESVG